ncbi:uncharacterized protein JN550_004712 [Neoarthrinium moseri]|uniref:uncharacterized protein n=1 Tax=Neoarthrinium moseri TaxID=1658444 RepID=UPI001FDC5CCD|nr:uncharacterized protein JN550_004712 [Neoarthrinium moseri]KAI1871267.1 hypothetical protein JN550_004712 [Neoarthrinium moseri]
MLRWHRANCRRPDISIAGGIVYCGQCEQDSSRCLWDEAALSNLEGTSHQSPNTPLSWPSSVHYTSTTADENEDWHKQSEEENLEQQCSIETTASAGAEILSKRGYTPVVGAGQIRLLHLDQRCRGGGVLHGWLRDAHVGDADYEALSYTWASENGDDRRCTQLFLGEWWDLLMITKNCDDALRALRNDRERRRRFDEDISTETIYLIWVDAVCIDQSNMQERTHQVAMMRDIFAGASHVNVYLGKTQGMSPSAASILSTMGLSTVLETLRDQSLPDHEALKAVFCDLVDRRYFTRIWVVQEVLAARQLRVHCGESTFDFNVFWNDMVRTLPDNINPKWTNWAFRPPPRTAEDLFDLLLDTSSCSSSDRRDRIFALLGLYQRSVEDGLEPIYTLSVRDIYTGVAAYFLTQRSSIDVLSIAEGISDTLPSWVPDWSKPRHLKIVNCEDIARRMAQHYNEAGSLPLLASWPDDTLEDKHVKLGISDNGALSIDAIIVLLLDAESQWHTASTLNYREVIIPRDNFTLELTTQNPVNLDDCIALIWGSEMFQHLRPQEESKLYKLVGPCEVDIKTYGHHNDIMRRACRSMRINKSQYAFTEYGLPVKVLVASTPNDFNHHYEIFESIASRHLPRQPGIDPWVQYSHEFVATVSSRHSLGWTRRLEQLKIDERLGGMITLSLEEIHSLSSDQFVSSDQFETDWIKFLVAPARNGLSLSESSAISLGQHENTPKLPDYKVNDLSANVIALQTIWKDLAPKIMLHVGNASLDWVQWYQLRKDQMGRDTSERVHPDLLNIWVSIMTEITANYEEPQSGLFESFQCLEWVIESVSFYLLLVECSAKDKFLAGLEELKQFPFKLPRSQKITII